LVAAEVLGSDNDAPLAARWLMRVFVTL